MALIREHELHQRRFGRNLGVGVTLGLFIVLVFGLTIAKVQGGGTVQAFDHTYRMELDPAMQTTTPPAAQPAQGVTP